MGSSSKEETASDGDTTSGGASPSNDGRLFSEGERVLAYHGPRVYGAKANNITPSLSLAFLRFSVGCWRNLNSGD
ncbi:unnamed protein product [Thlaspi arvense]|uniref:Uncharacterized protein n=1 Tax=Thlaspi arvense TaxID=13288 RepID=A0AAU9SZG3_THLAR|nr:unnamed protein product [Thlaspi arvense]